MSASATQGAIITLVLSQISLRYPGRSLADRYEADLQRAGIWYITSSVSVRDIQETSRKLDGVCGLVIYKLVFT